MVKKCILPRTRSTSFRCKGKRQKGRYKADDKSTTNINEAYKDGKTPPKKRGRPKGSKNKKK